MSAISSPFASLDALRADLGKGAKAAPAGVDPAYAAKMLHPFPAWDVVDRRAFILERVAGKVVLDVGATGPMHAAIVKAATTVYGWDREDGPGVTGIDLDYATLDLPFYSDVEVVVLGEVLEHLSNPGWFLQRLRAAYTCPTIISVPSAFSEAGRQQALRGVECVNTDHVAWYSPKTLSVLLARAGYRIAGAAYYNAKPIQPAHFAEGLVVVTE
jgi:hypothetical protein